MVVVDRQIAYVVRKRDGELTRRAIVAKEHICECIPALFGGVELLDERGGRRRDPGLCDWFSGGEDYDGGLACIDNGLDEGCLGTDEGQGVDVDVLACCCVEALPEFLLVAGPGSYDHDGDVGFLCCGNGIGETGFVVAPAFAALSVVDLGGVADGGFDSLEGCDAAVLA